MNRRSRSIRMDGYVMILTGILITSGGFVFAVSIEPSWRAHLQEFNGAYGLAINATVAVCTILLLLATLMQSQISRKSLDEARNQRLDGSNPLLLPHGYGQYGLISRGQVLPGLVVQNYGAGPALEVKLFVCESDPNQGYLSMIGVIPAGEHVAAGQDNSPITAGSPEYVRMGQVRNQFIEQGVVLGNEDAVMQLRCKDLYNREHVTYALYRDSNWVEVRVVRPGDEDSHSA